MINNVQNILIVSDDDLLPKEVNESLGDTIVLRHIGGDYKELKIPVKYDILRLHSPWDLRIPAEGYDCCVISLKILADVISDAALEALLHRARSVLWLTEGHSQCRAVRAIGQPVIELLLPCANAELHAAIGHLLLQAQPNEQVDGTDFLRNILAEQQQSIEPILSVDEYSLVHYPDIDRFYGPGVHAEQILEKLAERGAFKREVAARLRLCEHCEASPFIYEERCSSCKSLNFEMTPMLHHFSCAHVGPRSAFGSEHKRRCPKCQDVVSDIGRDHEYVGERMFCSCGMIAPEPVVMARCLSCGTVQSPSKTIEKIVWSYHVTERAEELALPGSGVGELTPLREMNSGLFSRAVLELEIEREHARCDRNNQVYTVIALVIHNLQQLREYHSGLSNEYIDALLKECANALRMQDLIGRWSVDTVVILLPETSGDNAEVVINRLVAAIETTCSKYLEPLPIIGLASESRTEDIQDGAALVLESIAQARREDDSESINGMVGTDNTCARLPLTDSDLIPLVVLE